MANHPADERWMRAALSLGRRGLGRTWPNPAVGCVIVKNGRVVGRGWTQPGGRPHGEVQALKQAGVLARGATAYVTLEPCAHTGQTPPCTEALINAGIARVASAMQDPDPRVAGKGHAKLQDANITVDVGCCAPEAAQDNAGFLTRTTQRRPFLALKLASSFDGRIATRSGESKWITSPAARRLVHAQRAAFDAVMIGAGTAQADDPILILRDLGLSHHPVRIVCDSKLSTDPNCQLGKTAKQFPLWLCHGPDAPQSAKQAWLETGAKLLQCQTGMDNRLDMVDALQVLGRAGLTRVYCEGGGQLAASLLASDLVDQLLGFIAGLALGANGTPSVAALPDLELSEYTRFSLMDLRQIGPDALHIWQRN
jgi:diaminohydroxyphosphoribosylaminopyrimidine deaminase / 5-amino-6-(5-phosphoribosylamino)uracil reductase